MSEAFEGGAAGGRGAWRDAAAACVALVGVADSVYLTVEHLSGRSVRCVVVSGCDAVLSSSYATVGGSVPLAAAGALAYFVVFSLATLAAFGYGGLRRALAAVVGVMFAFTLWLLYVQAFVLRAFCAYCLLSAAVTTALAVLVIVVPLVSRRRLA
ncbi:MAG TPA: vitamin K epoxide reductase family protein [Pyrinomonadaceae bacterium]|nr:vitamin K epoxide reductase family protein [Pyrinomonadaceae bacterium]